MKVMRLAKGRNTQTQVRIEHRPPHPSSVHLSAACVDQSSQVGNKPTENNQRNIKKQACKIRQNYKNFGLLFFLYIFLLFFSF